MPDAAKFLAGFGLIEGNKFGGYTLIKARAIHEAVRKYHKYRYEIDLEFTNDGKGTFESLFDSVLDHITQQLTIYGVKNPYRCTIDPPKEGDIKTEGNKITFNLIGHAIR